MRHTILQRNLDPLGDFELSCNDCDWTAEAATEDEADRLGAEHRRDVGAAE